MQRKHKMLFLCRRLQHARVGQNYGGIVIAVGHFINHHTVEHACLYVLFLHIQVTLRNAVIEYTLGNLQFGTLLLHGKEQPRERHVGARSHYVLKIERAQGYEYDDDHKRAERLHKRYARSLDGRKLAALAQVTEGDKRRKQDGQRKRLRHEHKTHIPEELGQHVHGQTLTDELVDIAPKKLHHQHELTYKERSDKEESELFCDKFI